LIKEEQCAGSIISTFNDYEMNNPLLITNYYQQDLCSFGVVDRSRKERLAYYTLQSLFNKEQEPLLNAGSYSERTPVSFIIVGLVLGIVIIFLTNRFRRFREYIFRSIFKPYNFYADIRDQRIMSSVQTMILGLVISSIFGILFSSLFYFYRTNELAQYCLMILTPSNALQSLLFRIIWMPLLFMLSITMMCFLFIFIISLIIRFFAFFLRARVYFSDSMVITIWSAVPSLILLPVAIVLIRLLVFSPELIWPMIFLIVGIIVWIISRIIRATAVVFDLPSFKVYLVGGAITIFVIVLPLTIYHFQYSVFDYGQYFIDVMMK
jgi:beta-galactosidase